MVRDIAGENARAVAALRELREAARLPRLTMEEATALIELHAHTPEDVEAFLDLVKEEE